VIVSKGFSFENRIENKWGIAMGNTSAVSRADATRIRKHLGHGKGDRRVRVKQNGVVEYWGTTDFYDREHDFWHFGGYATELLAEIKQQSE